MGQPSVEQGTEDYADDSSPTASPAVVRLKVRSVVILLVAVCLSMSTIAIWEAWNSRQYHLRDKEVAMSNLSQTLASQAQATIKQADTLLFTLVERLEYERLEPSQLTHLERLLSAQRSELPQLHGLFVYDENGRWVANSNGAVMPDANNADREYFIFHRDHPDRGPHIGPSIKSRSSGEWIMTVSRRINYADGVAYSLNTVYVLQALAQTLQPELSQEPVLLVLNRLAREQIHTVRQTLTVRVADADLARHLSMDIGMPVVRVIRLIMNRANQLVYAAQVFYPAKYLSIQTELTPGF